MATMTPEQYQAILQAMNTPNGFVSGEGGSANYGNAVHNMGGQNYMTLLTPEARMQGYVPGQLRPDQLSGVRSYQWKDTDKIEDYNGTPYQDFDMKGNQTGEGVWTGLQDDDSFQKFLMSAGALYGLGSFMNGGMLGFGGGGTGAGATTGAAGGGGGLGEAAAFNAAKDSQLANLAIQSAGGDALAGYTAAGIPSVAAGGAAGAGGLSGLLPSGVSSLLGPAATLAGGLLGSQKNTQSQTNTRDIPPWLKDSVMGLLNAGGQQFARSTSPERQAELSALRGRAAGLLGSPIAPNQFTR